MRQLHEITPDPARIVESLRDTGYSLNTAIADLVDNSIAANATRVSIEIALDPVGEPRFSITDDGEGMNEGQLVNAFKYGSAHRANPDSLGKFGLGLKTASTAFARSLQITSISDTDSTPATFVFDMDNLQVNGWKVQQLEEADASDAERISTTHGTVVRWKKIDRGFRLGDESSGQKKQKKLQRIILDLKEHLAMTFGRFLDPKDSRAVNVQIDINQVQIVSWNPFGHGSEETYHKNITIKTEEGDSHTIIVRSVTIPRRAEVQALYGPKGADEARHEGQYQGVYVFRENRMIHGPDWLGIWKNEPHMTLCRVELSFGYELDEAFQIDIKKSKILVDPGLEDVLVKALTGPRRDATTRYRDGKVKTLLGYGQVGVHEPSNKAIQEVSSSESKSRLQSTDVLKGSAVITNPLGSMTVKYSEQSQNIFVEAVDQLDFNVFYEPRWVNQNPAVLINKSHPFFTKVYLPNLQSGVTIQALDSLLWALANAEFDHTQDSTKEIFQDMRFHVSRTLYKLCEGLPEPEEDEQL
jgi:hypothetical protein